MISSAGDVGRMLPQELAIRGAFSTGRGTKHRLAFDNGGALSIDKSLDKGRVLSIGKIYVPQRLRVGRVQSLAEILISVCLGSHRFVGGMGKKKQ